MSKKFIKFPSLENHYRGKELGYWLDHNPELALEEFIITEKIDGSNFCIVISKDLPVYFQSRNQILTWESSFFDFQQALKPHREKIETLQRVVDNEHAWDEIRVYGEIFGEGVQRRIDYGTEKYFKPFEVWCDGYPKSIAEAKALFKDCGFEDWWVPVVAFAPNLETAMAIDVEDLLTRHAGPQESLSHYVEGVVISPLNKVYLAKPDDPENSSRFLIKKKSDRFAEVSNAKRKVTKGREAFKGCEQWERLKDIFIRHFNDNRVNTLISKLGPLDDMAKFSEYHKALRNDAKDDFLKDNLDQFVHLNDSEKKDIINSGAKLAASLLKQAVS